MRGVVVNRFATIRKIEHLKKIVLLLHLLGALVKDGFWISRERVVNSQRSRSCSFLSIRTPTLRCFRFSTKLFDSTLLRNVPLGEKVKIIMSTKLYVGNLSFNTSEQDLETTFGEFGTVTSANVIEDRETGRSRGFGFVEMSSSEEAKSAIASLDGKEIDGRNLKVNEAKAREDRGGSGGGRGRY